MFQEDTLNSNANYIYSKLFDDVQFFSVILQQTYIRFKKLQHWQLLVIHIYLYIIQLSILIDLYRSVCRSVCCPYRFIHIYQSIYLRRFTCISVPFCTSQFIHISLSLSFPWCIYQSIIIDFFICVSRLDWYLSNPVFWSLSLSPLSLSLLISIYIIYQIDMHQSMLSACASQLIHIYLSIYLRRFFESVYQTVCLSNPLYHMYLSIYLSINPADLYSSIYQTVCVLSQ